MEKFQQFIVTKAILDGEWRSDNGGKRRVMTLAELDALADFGWRRPDLKGVRAACANVVGWRWRSGPTVRRAGSPRMSAGS